MHVLSINPDGDYFKVALLSLKKKKIKISLIQEYKKDIVDLSQLKKEILDKTKGALGRLEIVSALSVDDIFIRNVKLPLKKRGAILKALPFQMETLLPFSKEDSTTISTIRKTKEGSSVRLYSYLNESMRSHLQEIKTLGFDPDYVSSVPVALHRFAEKFTETLDPFTIIHFGWEKSLVVSIEGGEVFYSVSIDSGFRDFIDAIKVDYPGLEEIDFAFIKREIGKGGVGEKGALNHVLEALKKGLRRVFEFLARKKGGRNENTILFSGYDEIMQQIVTNMEGFSYKNLPLKPDLEFDKEQITSYAIEIGLALDGLAKDEKKLQLRVGQFTSPALYQQFKKKMRLYIGLSVLCSSIAFFTFSAIFLKRQALARERFNKIVALDGSRISEYKNMQNRLISPVGCKEDVEALLKRFSSKKGEGLLLTAPPLVTECLQWVMPNIKPGVLVTHITYEMLQHPNLDDPKKPYQIAYKIAFTADSLAKADAFYKAILSSGGESIKESSIKGTEDVFEVVYHLKA